MAPFPINKGGIHMSLVVGVNAYADVNEYDDLLSSRFRSTSPIRVFWDSLSTEDKECVIVGNTLKYDKDSYNYIGYKQNIDQPLQYPRIVKNGEVEQCSDDIKLGIILQGIEDEISEGSTESEMIKNGVKSFADGTGARIEIADSSNGLAVKTCDGINRDIWMNYFDKHIIKEG